MPTYDERQTNACNAIRVRLFSIIEQANEALQCIGSDECSDLIDDISRDAAFIQDTNTAILLDKV